LPPLTKITGRKHVGDRESHNECTNKFVEIANELKDQGHDPQLISAALMAASGIYATFITAGNTGGLQPSGVDKVVMMYRRNLEYIQEQKIEENNAKEE
jgi:hypothetical protein